MVGLFIAIGRLKMTVQITTLENGLRIVSDTVSTVETISLGVWVRVGTRNEPVHLNGISHFLEHMAFKGTAKRTARQIVEEIEEVGGYLNAYTSRETTAYYARVLKEDAPLAIDIIADILQNSVFDEEEIAREKTVILQEIGQSLDTPDDIIFDHFQEIAFPNQPMGRPILGTANIIKNITAKDLKSYIGREYHPSRMVLAAAGNIDHDVLVKLAMEHFANEFKIEEYEFSPITLEKAAYRGGTYVEEKPLEQAHLVMGFEGIPLKDPGFYAASVFSTILGGGMSSRLFQEIREKRGLVYSIYSNTGSYQDTGIFSIYAGTSPKDILELVPVTWEEIQKLPRTLSDIELKRAKAQLKAGIMMGIESMSSRCEQLANHLLNYGQVVSRNEIIRRIEAVSPDDISDIHARITNSSLSFTMMGAVGKLPQWDFLKN